MTSPFTRKIDGPIRVVQVANIPGQYLAIDRLGRFLAQGSGRALEEMANAFNAKNLGGDGEELPVQVTACPDCGYPKESEDQSKCLSCLAPPLLTVEEEVKEKTQEQSEWF